MPDVGAEKRVGVHNGAAQEAEANVIVWRHPELRAEGAFVAEEWSGARHVGANSDGPKAELIVGQQIAGEGEEESEHEQDDSDVPIEFARLFVGAGEKHAE